MALDIYSVRAQLAALEVLPPECSFLQDTFCSGGETVEEDKAIFDYYKGTTPMAPMVHYGAGGVEMDRKGFETREIDFCTIAPERTVEMKHLMNRTFAEPVLGAMTPEQRSKKMQAKDLMEMRAAIMRRINWMVRQVALTGKLEVFEYANEGRNKTARLHADFGFTNNYTPETPWGQTGAKINYDMQRMFDLVYEGGGLVDVILMSPDVADAMLYDGEYVKQLDTHNVNVGELNNKYRGQGVRFVGYNIDGVEMYSVAGKFVDDYGAVTPIIPGGTLIAGSRGMLKDMYGPITQVEQDGPNGNHKTYVKKEVPLRYASVASNSVKNRLTSRPVIMPRNVDGWAVAQVL